MTVNENTNINGEFRRETVKDLIMKAAANSEASLLKRVSYTSYLKEVATTKSRLSTVEKEYLISSIMGAKNIEISDSLLDSVFNFLKAVAEINMDINSSKTKQIYKAIFNETTTILPDLEELKKTTLTNDNFVEFSDFATRFAEDALLDNPDNNGMNFADEIIRFMLYQHQEKKIPLFTN